MTEARIPVTLLTGFLGSGKTRVLSHLVGQPRLAAQRIRVQNGVVAPAAVLGLGLFDPAERIPDVARWLNAEAYPRAGGQDPLLPVAWTDHPHVRGQDPDSGHPQPVDQVPEHAEHGDHVHVHDPNRHDDRIRAFCLIIDQPLDDSLLDAWLERLRSLAGPDMLRIKAILSLRGRAAPLVIQGVQHTFYPPEELPAWPDGDRRSKIVFITCDISQQTIEETLGALLDDWQGAGTAPHWSPPDWQGRARSSADMSPASDQGGVGGRSHHGTAKP